MRDLILKLLGKKGTGSSSDAKQRLKFLLVHDQVDLPPAKLEQMKAEIMDVIARYCDVDTEGVEVRLHKEDGQVALVSNIPVRRVTAARAG